MTILILMVQLCIFAQIQGWDRINPFCRNRKVDRNHFNYNYFGPSVREENNLDRGNRNINPHIEQALNCGNECLSGRKKTCPDSDRRRRSADGPVEVSKRSNARKCDDAEIFCSVLVAEHSSGSPPDCALPVPWSEPTCDQQLTTRRWIKVGRRNCRIVQRSPEPVIRIANCSYKKCSRSAYGVSRICKPSNWEKKVFCVYCPGGTGVADTDPHGTMKIVTRYYPTSCTCNYEWCGLGY